jgi:hypothetical protein
MLLSVLGPYAPRQSGSAGSPLSLRNQALAEQLPGRRESDCWHAARFSTPGSRAVHENALIPAH